MIVKHCHFSRISGQGGSRFQISDSQRGVCQFICR